MAALAFLQIERDGESVKSLALEGEVVVGRAEDCVIRLNDRAVSRQHAVFRSDPDGIVVQRKSEFAPLSVNGVETTRAVLKEGDVISIGPYLLRLKLEKAEKEALATMEAPALADVAAEILAEAPVSETSDPVISLSFAPKPAVEDSPVEATSVIQTNMGGDAALDFESAEEDAQTKLTTAAKVDVRLVFPDGMANYKEFELTQDEVSIGRGKSCTIVLNDKKSSRKHAIIRRAGLVFVIKDLESANGTYVNGEKVTERELASGDKISLGDVDFHFQAMNPDYAAQAENFLPVPTEQPEPEPVSEPEPLPEQVVQEIPQTQIPGLGFNPEGTGPRSLVDKFKALPPRTRLIAIVVAGLGLMTLLDELQPTPAPVKTPKAKPSVVASAAPAGPITFDQLSPKDQTFVDTQHRLAFDHFRNNDFDKAIYEIRKIFPLVSDYKDSKDIERYAIEGKRRQTAIEEERKRKEEEAALKRRIDALVEEGSRLMAKKDYAAAKEKFGEIMSVDPDNIQIAKWKKEIEDYEEEKVRKARESQIDAELNKLAWETYRSGVALMKRGRYHSAIEKFGEVSDKGGSDKRPINKAKKMIAASRKAINVKRDPILASAKSEEESGNLAQAYQLYRKATKIDPPHPAGYAGMARIRSVLHERSKGIYAEAVIAESYSDFGIAKKKYEEILTVAPEDDVYYQRAKRKLSRYLRSLSGASSEAPPP